MTYQQNREKSFHSPTFQFCIYVFLVIATVYIYWPVRNFDFVHIDDSLYVAQNAQVQSGLNLESIGWAFTSNVASNWHPLTWLSHMVDVQLFGFDPGWHHLVNLFFHIVNTLLLFFVLQRLTGTRWQSLFVATLFAIHPLHVESVAWVSERKDVLSTLFWLLTMWSYIRYTDRPGLPRYMAVFLSLGLGLLAKPMLVTLPFVLLLLDYWPLRRSCFGTSTEKDGPSQLSILKLVLEKVPLLVLVIASSIVTFLAQHKTATVGSLEKFPIAHRLANALIAYTTYLGKMIWPTRLAVFYPYPENSYSWLATVGSLILIVAITVFVIRQYRERPYLPVGWFWYLGTLVPVIGLVQVGDQSMADRYTYIPLIGIFIALAWAIPSFLRTWQYSKIILPTIALLSVLALIPVSRAQIGYWQNSITLFNRALAVTENNYLAHNNIGNAFTSLGRFKEAKNNYFEALRIKPDYTEAYYNLGNLNMWQGEFKNAVSNYRKALRIRPDYIMARLNLGIALQELGQHDGAIKELREVIRLSPKDAKAHNNLGMIWLKLGRTDDAIKEFREALRITPGDAKAHNNLGGVLLQLGRTGEAIKEFKKALLIMPDYASAHSNLGIALGELGRINEAISEFNEALRLDPNSVDARRNLSISKEILKRKSSEQLKQSP